MSNKRKLRPLNKTSGLAQRPKHTWGMTNNARKSGLTKNQIRNFLNRRKDARPESDA